ncbi:Hpt domain-containing protein [Massilia sp. TS11]|uniref:hybrid sensor histidine kinase/response regulator n=1 Tax=Massilia sp. TS11 TaxID=2908003 RepID=UPI001ED9F579|nr:Hpt domain-containing protein [Massilia sp. TS11]MCG2583460.1 Hpt domain-containing protein [Massilia sp. TS11]
MNQPARPSFDSGPLSWVMGEVREALARSRAALDEATQQSLATPLQHARTHLHQAAGALQMVDVEGVPVLLEAAEQLLDALKNGAQPLDEAARAAIGSAYDALLDYLDELLAGVAPQPVRLFPYYQALRERLGADRIHPADLLALDSAAFTLAAPADAAPADIGACRARFEKGLLLFLKSADDAARQTNARALAEALAPIAAAQTDADGYTLWRALEAVAALVADGLLAPDLYLKQLLGMINLQIRRLAQGQGGASEALLRDALFFVAAARDGNASAAELRAGFGLDGLVPSDYLQRRYGSVDRAALAAAREALARAKSAADGADDAALQDALSALQQACAALPAALARLSAAMASAQATARDGLADPAFGLELATALLFTEHGLDQARRLPEEFGAQADLLGERLQALASGAAAPEAPQWQSDLMRQIQQGQTVATLAGEIQHALRTVEKTLEDFSEDASRLASLGELEATLHQLRGAFAILDLDQAVQAVDHVQGAIADLLAAGGAEASALEPIARNVGALGFFTEQLGHQFDAARARFVFDSAAGLLREAVPGEVVEAAAPSAAPAPAPQTQAAEAPDAELLEIFIGEAQEVLAAIMDALPAAQARPDDQATLTRLRRSFHTLKGSGRMVALDELADAAAAIEKTLNAWLAESRSATPDLLALLEHAAEEFGAWVDELVDQGQSARSGAPLVEAARRVLHGEPVEDAAAAPALDEAAPPPSEVEIAVADLAPEDFAFDSAAPQPAEADKTAIDVPLDDLVFDEAAPPPAEVEMAVAELSLDDFAFDSAAPQPAEADKTAVDVPLDDLVLDEAAPPPAEVEMAVADLSLEDFAFDAALAQPAEPDTPASDLPPDDLRLDEGAQAPADAEAAATELSFEDFAFDSAAPQPAEPDLDAEPEPLLPELAPGTVDAAPPPNVIEFPSVVPALPPDDNTKRIGPIDIPLPLFNIYLAETDEIQRLLEREFSEWRIERPRPVRPEALKAVHTLAGTSGTVGFTSLRELAQALESVLEQLQPPAPALDDAQFDLLDTTLAKVRQMLAAFASGDLAGPEPELVAQLKALRETLKTRPALSPQDEHGQRMEALFAATYDAILADPPVLEPVSMKTLEARPSAKVVDEIDDLFASAFEAHQPTPAPAPVELAPADTAIEYDAHELILPEPEPEAAPLAATVSLPADELDPDLLPVFLEEGADLFPAIGVALRRWQADPADTASAQQVLRTLHTVKGSARMAGAMRLGQHTHDIETQVENMLHAGTSTPEAFDELLANFDQALLMFEQLQQPAAPQVEEEAAAPGAPEEGARVPLVRVRADILDRLVNQAGEVAIARSKLENQVGAMKAALSDLGDNLLRLRHQLREVELQAESQIASRLSIAGEREFDPLEFDRFTRLQELTRMMAESVSDVASLHDSLNRNADRAGEDLLQQARMTRELQHDLMRVRMVPFSSIGERLFRIARQAAKELDKRVNLDIRGGSVEMDRSVLEQMAAPFEHLLRNAIVHGIESRIERAAAGKPETGELLIQVSQQGNEVVLSFADDGAGLNLARIRAKAVERGLLTAPDEVNDAEAADLIFEPGFSTADSLTELAGRGVGMDVVRSEAQALGGRIAIDTAAGKGTRFTIHLPLTLAVTQVVLVESGGRTYALPSTLVETLMQVKEAAAQEARAAGCIAHRGQTLPMHYLSHLLGDAGAQPLEQRSCPLLVLKHGPDRLAVQVDSVSGNREVVVKNIGPQLARMAGIAGATVLGSGDIVLILNPVAMAHYLAHHPELKRHFTDAPAQALAAPRTLTVMVVDDSVTVRKVTQRLLEREGYQVVLAKDGVDALEQVQQHKPDLMLVDIEMPRMDGFDLTRAIRGNEATRDIPIIMITSRSADKHRNLALELGVNAYFGKPYQEPILLAAIAGLIQP